MSAPLNELGTALAYSVMTILGLAVLGFVLLVAGSLYIVAKNTARHIRNGNVRRAVRFATLAADTAANGEIHGRGGVVFEWLLAFVIYREGELLSIATDYSEKSDERVYTTIEAS